MRYIGKPFLREEMFQGDPKFSAGFYMNPASAPFLEDYICTSENVDWCALCSNIEAVHLVARHLDKVNWRQLSINPAAATLLCDHPDKVIWYEIARNPATTKMVRKHPKEILWGTVFGWTTDTVLMEGILDQIDWNMLSLNTGICAFIYKHLDKVNWLSLSTNSAAMYILRQYPEKIRWDALSRNAGALPLLLEHPEKVDWFEFCRNPIVVFLLKRMAELREVIEFSPGFRVVNFIRQNFEYLKGLDTFWVPYSWHPAIPENPNPSATDHKRRRSQDDIQQFMYMELQSLHMEGFFIEYVKDVDLDQCLKLYYLWLGCCYTPSERLQAEFKAMPSEYRYLLYNHPDCFHYLSLYDYSKMEANMAEFKAELLAAVYHPDRLKRQSELLGLSTREQLNML